MEVRPIDAKALREEIMTENYDNDTINNFLDLVDFAPTLDYEPVVHAHWTINTDDFTPAKRCSHCGYNRPILAGENIKQEPDDYCNKCGAKMDEKEK